MNESVLVNSIGSPVAHGDDSIFDPKLQALMGDYERLKTEQLIELNAYIKKIRARLKQVMREEDLPSANLADRELKKLVSQNTELMKERERVALISSLAGDWELATSRWGFRVFADGRVWPLLRDEPHRGRISVIDLEKRIVRLTGFP